MPTPAIPSTEQFAQRFRFRLPPGSAWSWCDIGQKLLEGMSPEQARFRESVNQLLVDILPQTTVNLLPEWLASVSLPDECSDPNPSNEDVLARLRGSGAESYEEYLELFTGSEIEEYFISRVDILEVDAELVDDYDWQHTWVLKVPDDTLGFINALVDETEVDEPIEDFAGNFNCVAQREFSAHHFVFVEPLES